MYGTLGKVMSEKRMTATTTNTLQGLQGLQGRVPKQIQRLIPAAIACFLLIIFYSHTSSFNDLTRNLSPSRYHQDHFPRKIWQTWKVEPLLFEERDLLVARSWTAKNPSYRYEVLTDANDMRYVEEHFGPSGFNRPDIVHVYRTLNARIIKADLLRYLIMYVEGGVYADIDVEAIRPIERFVPDRYDEKEVDMVIGVEIDNPDFINHPILGQKSQSFCQWTFMCKPQQPVMLHLVDNILKWLHDVAARQKKQIADLELDFDEVIIGTGPSAFTGAILAEMSRKSGKQVGWSTFHNIAESKLVGGILVLTVEAFAAGQGHSDSGNHDARNALIKHHYHASGWPTQHPRFSHPMYGEVEQCNWDKECVRLWDSNTAAFDLLPEDEKARLIAVKTANDAREKEEKDRLFREGIHGP